MSISDQVSMFYNASPEIFEKAKYLRKNMTSAERILWEHLKGKKMLNLRFRPQHPIYKFIADFYCHPLKIIIEIDGGIHHSNDQHKYDIDREDEIRNWGIKIIRFNNEEIVNNLDNVLNKIKEVCINQTRKPLSPL